MASAGLGEELSCSICLSLYTEPVSLRCGHIFCGSCIVAVLDRQEGSGVYSCPECREEYTERPALEKNRKLSNIAETFRSTQQVNTEISCTYCVDTPVAAVKTCLQCETSMCEKHLTAHNKMVDHVLVEPISSISTKKCPIHKQLLEYYCSEDAACLCVSCSLVGKHKGHQVKLLNEASEKKKEKLRDILKQLTSKRGAFDGRIQSLQKHREKVQENTDGEKKRVTTLFEDIRRQLEVQEKRVLSEVSRQEEKISQSVLNQIRQLETQKDELSRKISQIEELCNMSNPITILQYQESDPGDQDEEGPSVSDLGSLLISLTLRRSIDDVITDLKSKNLFSIQEKTDLLLDEKTANYYVALSDERKTATDSETRLDRPDLPERFTQYSQVMSVQSFSSGRHYWEVKVSDSGDWDVGMSYSSIDRGGGKDSSFGENNKSWTFRRINNECVVWHNKNHQSIQLITGVQKLGVYLDYEAGRLSFYQLCDPIRHLHTFTTTFTEPLHAALYVNNGGWIKIRT